jgi:kinesin family member 2/24
LYSFHEAAFRLQEMEEDVVDSHKVLLSALPKWQESVDSLLATTDRIDFDVEGWLFYVDLLRFASILSNWLVYHIILVMFSLGCAAVYVQQMESVLGEIADDIFRLKTKFAKFSRELQEEDERSQAVKLVNNRRTGYSKQD